MGYLRSWCCFWKSLQSRTIRRPSLNLRKDFLHAACKPIIPDPSFTILPVRSPPYSCRYVKSADMYTICESSYNWLFTAPSELITPSTPCSVSLIKMTWVDSCRNSWALTSRYDCSAVRSICERVHGCPCLQTSDSIEHWLPVKPVFFLH